MELTLKRFNLTDDGVQGVLLAGTSFICFTLEEEWKDNAKGISCIPSGVYTCNKFKRPSGLETYQIMNVPGGRTLILFHPGTTELDTEGCVLTGCEFGFIDAVDDDTGIKEKQLAILRSKEGFKLFMDSVHGREAFQLIVKWC